MMKPCTKWADRVHNLKRIPEQVNFAFQKAMSGKPGPVYLDFPGDVLYAKSTKTRSIGALSGRPIPDARPLARANRRSRRWSMRSPGAQPIISPAAAFCGRRPGTRCRPLSRRPAIPFYTTPQGRGVVPDDHPYSYLTMRSTAFRDADLIIVRRHPDELRHRPRRTAALQRRRQDRAHRYRCRGDRLPRRARSISAIVGDCKAVLRQLIDAAPSARHAGSFRRLARTLCRRRDGEAPGAGRQQADGRDADPSAPPVRGDQEFHAARRHPVRRRPGDPQFRPSVDADLHARPSPQFRTVRHDGRRTAVRHRRQGRQARQAGHRPARRRLVRPERDGARHRGAPQRLPILVVVSLNGGWTADPDRNKPGRDLGYTRFDKMAEGLGCYGEYVERPDEIRPALDRAQKKVDAAWSRSSTSRPTTAPAPPPPRSPNIPLKSRALGVRHDKPAFTRECKVPADRGAITQSSVGDSADQVFLRSREQVMAGQEHGRSATMPTIR